MSLNNQLLKSLDNPIRVLFWEIDEFLLMVIPVLAGILVGSFSIMISGFLIKPLYSRLKKVFPRGRLQHKLYWLFPYRALVKAKIVKNIPPSHIRDLVL